MATDFYGLRVEISRRVRSAWRRTPSEEIDPLWQAYSAVWKQWSSSCRNREIKRLLKKDIEYEERLRSMWTGPQWIADCIIPHWVIHREENELLTAYRSQDWQAVERIAQRMKAREKRSGRAEESMCAPNVESALMLHWLDRDGLCLAWLSVGALEFVLRAAGLWQPEQSTDALRLRVQRLGLPSLKPALVHRKHVSFSGGTLTIT